MIQTLLLFTYLLTVLMAFLVSNDGGDGNDENYHRGKVDARMGSAVESKTCGRLTSAEDVGRDIPNNRRR